jgi:hypothetical protein
MYLKMRMNHLMLKTLMYQLNLKMPMNLKFPLKRINQIDQQNQTYQLNQRFLMFLLKQINHYYQLYR